ncbi:RNA helicase [Alteripontixanthobacter maritimus]|uniref:RNA helicase n=1 Tax=Alteripontixanthobacter maritimus TaxID=2161824 RepID=A0A369QAU9_9SPHN|nr:ATP-dependent helicase HrpB [Alteripontixanthobacter maritimus]RDC60357.1 RNA helicase [Alteripontixanthobacter maritimus]
MASNLPIHAVLPDLLRALDNHGAAVLVAPPGAGKTTAVAPALLDQPWCDGEIILLSPRRVAARAAAERMAQMLGEKPGETVGYLTRMDTRRGPTTRILVMTEAIFVNRIVADPELPGVSAVLFDEAHERHLDSDLGLALALESRSVLREDLRICVMSATIDGARFADLLGPDAVTIESEGKAWPLRIEWLGSSPQARTEDAMTDAILTAWRGEEGDILAFLPGVREIDRTAERLEVRLPNVPVLPLHGQVDPASQRAAIARDRQGRRRIVLATAIAETSLTLDGVSVVVDSGLSRRAEHDVAAGTTHLVTTRSSQAAAGQRAGRAARLGPGVAYRLWEKAAHPGRPPYDPPEMLTADLAPLALTLAQWGARDIDGLPWLDTPPAAAMAAANRRLVGLGAVDETGRITDTGRKLAKLPMDPASAAMLLFGAENGAAWEAAKLALLLQERGLGGRGEDLAARMQRWDGERGKRADASRRLAARWATSAETLSAPVTEKQKPPLAILLATGRPDMVARRRDASGEQWLTAGGRGFVLDPASPLATAEWLVIGDAQGKAKAARITAAIRLEPEDVITHLAARIESRQVLNWNNDVARVEARLERRLGAITLASGPDPDPDSTVLVDMLVEKAVERLGTLLPPTLLARARHAGIAELSVEVLAARTDQWLAPLLEGRRDLGIGPAKLADAALATLDWDSRQRLDRLAPMRFTSPDGSTLKIDYAAEAGPTVSVRPQALFGLDTHPAIGQPPIPLMLELLSPGGKPIQLTADLPAFWRGSWRDVCRDMKGRYPKHRWPEEPWNERPSLKTKNAFARSARVN